MKNIIYFFRTLIAVIKDPDLFLAFKIFIKGLHALLLPEQGIIIKHENELYVIHKHCENNEWVVTIASIDTIREANELKEGMLVTLIKEPEEK